MTDISRISGDPEKDASRLLATSLGNFDGVLFQRDQIPTASEWTLVGQVAADRVRRLAAALAVPGFSTIEIITVSGFDLTLPICRAVVGDEAIRVGQGTGGVSPNVVTFGNPPPSGTRIDVLILESWVSEVAPIGADGSTSQAITVGGRRGGTDVAANAAYAIQDPEVGEETARRLALRWALRVVEGIDLVTYPNGLGDPVALGRGDATGPIGGKPFVEMADRTSVYRAGDGSEADALAFANATGYTFALPVIAILRTAGESGLTLTGSTELRKQIVSRVGVSMAQGVLVLSRNNHVVGGYPGETTVWRQPGGGTASFPSPSNITGADSDTPLSGAFPLFPSDFDLPPGWGLKGQLHGVVWREKDDGSTSPFTFGIRVRKPSQVYGESAVSGTWSLTSSSSLGSFANVEDHTAEFSIEGDGSEDGLWVVELYTDQAGPNNWHTAGIYLRLWATNE